MLQLANTSRISFALPLKICSAPIHELITATCESDIKQFMHAEFSKGLFTKSGGTLWPLQLIFQIEF